MAKPSNRTKVSKRSDSTYVRYPFEALAYLFLIGLLFGFVLGVKVGRAGLWEQAIKAGHAEHNATNGKMQWKEHPFTWNDLDFTQ